MVASNALYQHFGGPGLRPEGERKQWLDVFNSAYAAAIKDGESKADAEAKAFKEANGVAGPNAKVAVPRISKAVGTKETGFVRKIDGPFRCGHCEHMEKAAGKAGVCVRAESQCGPGVEGRTKRGRRILDRERRRLLQRVRSDSKSGLRRPAKRGWSDEGKNL